MNRLKETTARLTSKSRVSIVAPLSGLFLALLLALSGAAHLSAQAKPDSTHASTPKLTEQESRGEGLFLQRCSLCHLPRKLKFGSPPVVGPTLTGLFKEADADQQKFLRGFILRGDPKMPGFQYGLEANEVDDLIAYLKTL
jgi:mono/diheme cytochrome c family protein